MRFIVLGTIAVILAGLEVTLLGALQVDGVVPDLMLVYVVFLSFHFPLESAVVMCGALGLLKDTGSGLP
ncbi:MAG: hypothetical protein RDV41_09385, partial [Planctomycetota bacterium]|nr:hypothetical protein [Planctomycetota bacterium]